MPHAAEREEPWDDEAQEESGSPGLRKRERGPNLRDRNCGIFTDSERSTLRNAYLETPYPSRCELNALAEKFDKPRDKVSKWFSNQRQRQRRLETEQEEQSGDVTQEEGGAPGSRKRERRPKLRDRNYRRFTDRERSTLRNAFIENPHPSRCELNALADELDKPLDKVYTWFVNQRQRGGRLETEQEELLDDEAQEEIGTQGFRKRVRGTNLMQSEWSTLRNAYIENPYPSRCELNALAEKLDKPWDKVCKWFEHQRYRQRRLETEQEEQSDDETKGEGGTPGSRKREPGPKLRDCNYVIFTDSDRSTLRNAFIENPYPSRCELNALADELDKPRDKVSKWFSNQRQRQHRPEAEQEELLDDEAQEDSGIPGFRKRERGPKLRDRNHGIFADSERSTLRNAFMEDPYPSRCKVNALADELDKPRDKVKNWFKTQRRTQRRLETEQEEQSDDEAQEESGTPGSRKGERGPKLRDRNNGKLTDSEISTLRNAYIENPYPSQCELNALADELDKPWAKVYQWFVDQRQTQRRLETEQGLLDDEAQEDSGTPGSRKRERGPKLRDRKFTDSERSTLRNAYIDNPSPSRGNGLAEKLDNPLDKVKSWFRSQREKQRRLESEQKEQSGVEQQEEQSRDEPHEESAPVTQELGLECPTPQYSVGRESPGLAASEVSPASAEVGVIPRIPDGFQLFGIGSAIFTSHSMTQEHKLQEAALKTDICIIFDV